MATSNEGKTLAGNACGGCDNDNVTMHCEECPIHLCDNCAKYHKRMPATAAHYLKSVSVSTEYIPRSGNVESLSISCAFHSGLPITLVCTTCKEVMCESCKPQHEEHKVVRVKYDLHLLQQIALEEMSRLLKQIQKLDQEKIALQDNLTVYKDAKKRVEEWRKVILDCTNKGADGLQNALDQKLIELERLVKSKGENVDDCSTKCDQQVANLNNIKRTTNPDTLIERITQSTHLTNTARRIVKQGHCKGITVDEILPNSRVLELITENSEILFSAKIQFDTKCRPAVEYDKQQEKQDMVISGNKIWFITETVELDRDILILFRKGYKDVISFNLNTFQKKSFNCKVEVNQLVCISRGRCVMKEHLKPFVHLLDDTFNVICTLKQDDLYKYEYSVICLYDHNTILQCVPQRSNLTKCAFRKVLVNDDQFSVPDLITTMEIPESPTIMCLHNSKEQISLVDEKMLIRIDLHKSKIEKCDLSNHISNKAWSLYVDADDNTLIGDQSGAIHLYTPADDRVIIQNAKSDVFGITIRSGKMFVSVGFPSHMKIFG